MLCIFVLFLLSLYGCYTQVGVKDEYGYSASDQAENTTYVDQGPYYGYEDYSLGCEQRYGFSYYYPSIFPSEEFSFTSANMWSLDFQPYYSSPYGYGYGYGYGTGGYVAYSGAYYHPSYFHYLPAYARNTYQYNSIPPGSGGAVNPSPAQDIQGGRDVGGSRFDVPTTGNVDLPRGAVLGGSPRVVAPSTPTQTSVGNSNSNPTQRSSTTPPANTGKRGATKRGGNTRSVEKPKNVTLPTGSPNVRTPDQNQTSTPSTPTQTTTQPSNTPAQTQQPPPAPPPTNSNGRQAGTSRDNPPH